MLSDLLTKSAPKYATKLTSKDKTVYFRPFLVREEKSLLLALQEEKESSIMKCIADIIYNCVDDIGDPLKLPIYDVENLFLQIRSKSIGEIIELHLKDEDTGEIVINDINIEEIKFSSSPKSGEIKISEEITVNFRYPILKDFVETNADFSTTDGYYNLIAKCLMSIETPEEKINVENYTITEVKDFLESMNKTQFKKVLEFFRTMPKLTHTVEYTNSIGSIKKIKLEGLQDFFGLPSVTSI